MITRLHFIQAWLVSHTKSERGASLVEYALLVALIAVVCITAVTFLADQAEDTFSDAASQIEAGRS